MDTATTTVIATTDASPRGPVRGGSGALALFAWLSPGFPVGAFAYSHGLEAAVESGDVHDRATCAAWIDDLVAVGSIRSDCVLLAAAWGAADPLRVNDLALALAPSRERHLETSSQGTAFLAAVAAAWPAPALVRFVEQVADGDTAYPVAIGVAAAAHDLPLRETLAAFALAAVSTLVSAVLRLGPIGQSEAQAIIAGLCPTLGMLADWAATSTLADLGGAAWRADIASMRHETQYSRLFRS